MSTLENFTFKPILILFRLLFLNINIATKTNKHFKLSKWRFKHSYIKNTLLLFKISIVILAWSMLFYYQPELADIFEESMQQFQKLSWTLAVSLVYATSNRSSYAIPKLIHHIRRQPPMTLSKLTSPFPIIITLYATSYTIQSVTDIVYYIFIPKPYYTLVQYAFYELGYVLNVLFVAMICTFENLIYQQYCECNKKLRVKLGVTCVTHSDVMSLCEQCRLLNYSLGGYMIWRVCYVYVSTIQAVYYTMYLRDTAWVNLFWLGSILSEFLMIVYFHERRLKEVRC